MTSLVKILSSFCPLDHLSARRMNRVTMTFNVENKFMTGTLPFLFSVVRFGLCFESKKTMSLQYHSSLESLTRFGKSRISLVLSDAF